MKLGTILFGIIVVFLSGCKEEVPGPNEVLMVHSKFYPVSITIPNGTTVTWRNNETGTYDPTHSVTSDSNIFDSGDLYRDAIFSYTFSTSGTFTYHDNHHREMKGVVVVL